MGKKIALLGSTGVIGQRVLQVARQQGIKVAALATRSNIDVLEGQALEFQPDIICVFEEKSAKELKFRRPMWNIVSGVEGLCEVASYESADIAIMALQGSIGILPVVEALRAKKHVALANQEVLVAAGHYVTTLAKENGVNIFSLDRQQSSLTQCLKGEKQESIHRLILTASGGPLFFVEEEKLQEVTAADISPSGHVNHSTLMDKGFKIIEAHWLFGIPVEKIDVIIHPQEAVHSLVEFIDGSIKAGVGEFDYEMAIQYAITYPERTERTFVPFDFTKYQKLEFYQPNWERFKCLNLAYHALKVGGTLPCVLHAANEVLVERFTKGEVSWLRLSEKLEDLLSRHTVSHNTSIDTILEVDRETRLQAQSI